ncbi:ANM_HP_G0033090.mRNA.1.CDS.1 [Saccharomyces cerevisiae]|nr:ANM_HP_G0122920.mRNA.1.CDS.1 [Saccharomyces cerevisiae]CAI5069928.1 ANM_HP_G0205520.mRNA.1.CDS.1 [Saccharomyces cerevisiae]CAI5219413.1 ANM_HP_G0033090.mRNA.1.CDS.1 [Saccharomyces cerevisiae]CAI6580372.1 ANM_HP_G0122920.mRNA.1.CDS.1 [Saccharomyces cerevisiae]CAI6596920.1 ANM_collapsed_G0025930.mRNA.1.CDS.1 [Saccharomyces cerevisiae]
MFSVTRRRAAGAAAAMATATGTLYWMTSQGDRPLVHNDPSYMVQFPTAAPPQVSRRDLLDRLAKTHQFDVLIIGGGATGTGCALDAATRGLNVALVEKGDFASGTSSKSTKMIHGGVRYLEKAFWEFSKAQLDLVIEALNERKHLINTAPHLCTVLPILIPIYSTWQVPYIYMGCKFYDFFAGSQNLKKSYLLSKSATVEKAPMLTTDNLKASLVYHDGSFNDSRLNATLAITAVENGATVLNYVEVQKLIKDPTSGKVIGAEARDVETNELVRINAKCVVNATGPYSDAILQMDRNPSGLPDSPLNDNSKIKSTFNQIAVMDPKMVIPSIGVHIVLPSFYCPKDMGLLDVRTSDGRVMFFLPWQGKVLAGTTDIPLKQVPENPMPTEADIQDILKELQHYIEFPVKREDVLSAWAGVRPLVRDPCTIPADGKKGSATQGVVRSHFLFTSDNGLITIAGGKWTTYRQMAEETVDKVVEVGGFHNLKPCHTRDIKLAGAEEWTQNYVALLAQNYHLSSKMSNYLVQNYGTRSSIICEFFKESMENKLPLSLADKENNVIYSSEENTLVNFDTFRYPFTIGELKYSMQYEYCRTPLDFLLRRTRFAFLDAKEALNAVHATVKVMGDEFNWSEKKRQWELEKTVNFIKTFGV